MSLYKYLPPERFNVLENGTMAVSLPTERNDPFDELPAVDIEFSDEELRKIHPDLSNQSQLEKFKAFLRLQKSQQSVKAADRLRKGQAEIIGAICLSRVWNSIPMWSYYAREHRGFVVEFDETHRAFLDRFGGNIHPIIYGKRPLIRGPLNCEQPLPHMTKAPAWAHEKEERILCPLNDCAPSVTEDEQLIYLTAYPREAVTRVLLGCRMAPYCRTMIQRNLRRWGFKDTRLVALSPHHERFSFVIEDVPVSEAGV